MNDAFDDVTNDRLLTADICDERSGDLRVVQPGLQSYGGKRAFAGPIETVRIDEDNAIVRETLSGPGDGRFLIVDNRGKVTAVVGDRLGSLAIENGWSGVIVNGYVRDTRQLVDMPLGVLALGTFPRRSSVERSGERSVPVSFLGVDFEQGWWVVVDEDGVVVMSHRPSGV